MRRRHAYLAARSRKRLMDFRLQFGYGMMEHCRSLLKQWAGGHVILSPRDLTDQQMRRLSKELSKLPNVSLSVDPQFYLPHADHFRLSAHSFWPAAFDSDIFWTGPALTELIRRILQLNKDLGSSEILLPGILASSVDDDWLVSQQAIVDEASAICTPDVLVTTVALSSDVLRDAQNVGMIVEAAERWSSTGVYVVAEHPSGEYLVDDANWLANLVDLLAGLKLAGKRVTLGYANHQELIAAIAKTDAIASGTWMNVRSFPPEKFRSTYEEEIKQRSVWYYCPQALSEYKVPFLDIAYRQGILDDLRPDEDVDGGYVRPLFAGGQPSSIGLPEQLAFRHYLHALRAQVLTSVEDSFDATVRKHSAVLDRAAALLPRFAAAGVRGQLRDFSEIVDVNRAAIAVIESTRGPVLRRRWASL